MQPSRKVYSKPPSYKNKTYFYAIRFGQDIFISASNEPTKHWIRQQWNDLADAGKLLSYNIEPDSKAFVERVDQMEIKSPSPNKTQEFEQKMTQLKRMFNAVNREKPTHPADLINFIEAEESEEYKITEKLLEEIKLVEPTPADFIEAMVKERLPVMYRRYVSQYKKMKSADRRMWS